METRDGRTARVDTGTYEIGQVPSEVEVIRQTIRIIPRPPRRSTPPILPLYKPYANHPLHKPLPTSLLPSVFLYVSTFRRNNGHSPLEHLITFPSQYPFDTRPVRALRLANSDVYIGYVTTSNIARSRRLGSPLRNLRFLLLLLLSTSRRAVF